MADPVVEVLPKTDPPKPRVISEEDHEKALSDLHKFKKEAQDLKEKMRAEETRKLTETQQFKTLWENEQKASQDLKSNLDKTMSAFIDDKKSSALRDECVKLGLRAEAVADLDMVDLSGLKHETTSLGRVNIHGSKEAAERLKQLKPHWFGPGKGARVNTETPEVVPGTTVTIKQVLEAQAKWKKSQSPEDLQEYDKINRAFAGQNRR